VNIAASGAIANSSNIRPYKASLRNTYSRSERIKYVWMRVVQWDSSGFLAFDGMKLDSRDCGAALFGAELRVEPLDISQLRARIGNFEQTKTRLVSMMRRIPVQQPPRIQDGRTSRTIWRGLDRVRSRSHRKDPRNHGRLDRTEIASNMRRCLAFLSVRRSVDPPHPASKTEGMSS